MVVNALFHAAVDFHHVHPFGAQSEVLLHEIGVAAAAGDAHGHAADIDVRLVAHLPHRHGAPRERQNFLPDVRRNAAHVGIAHVAAVDGKRRQSALRVRGHDSRQIHRARPFGAVEAPHRFDRRGIQIHRLAAVAPARRDGQRGDDVKHGELLLRRSRLRAAADGRIGDHALDGTAVGVKAVFLDQLFGGVRHAHGLRFQTLPDPQTPPVDDGTYTDSRFHTIFSPFKINFVPYRSGQTTRI